jgi:hypothetical protein
MRQVKAPLDWVELLEAALLQLELVVAVQGL